MRTKCTAMITAMAAARLECPRTAKLVVASTLGVFGPTGATQLLVGMVRSAIGLAIEVVTSRTLIGCLTISAIPRPFVRLKLTAVRPFVGIEPRSPDRTARAMGTTMKDPRWTLLTCITSRRTRPSTRNTVAAPPAAPIVVMVFSVAAHRAEDPAYKVTRSCISPSTVVCVIEIGLARRPAA